MRSTCEPSTAASIHSTSAFDSELPRRCDDDVAVIHGAVIPLQEQRTGRAFVTVEGATGDARNLLVHDHRSAVGDDGHHSSNERDVICLPLSRRLRRDHARRQESVDRAEPIVPRRITVVVLYLHLVAPAQIDAAVALLRVAELDVELEIAEGAVGDEITPGPRAAQHTADDAPLVGASARMPAAEVV